MHMYCPHCNSVLSDNATICTSCGMPVKKEKEFVAPGDGKFSFDVEFAEKENAWYVATLRSVRKDGKTSIVSAASPIYFRGPDFKPPEVVPLPLPLPENIKERLLYLTPEEVDTDAWYDELKQMLKEAS